MATLIPSGSVQLRTDIGRYRELALIEQLEMSLPDNYEIFHGLPMQTAESAGDQFGEIDIAVLAPHGALLLMEVKAGSVILRDGGIFKLYGGAECDVSRQCNMQLSSMIGRLAQAQLRPAVIHCLAIPDFHLVDGQPLSLPRERIFDATRCQHLGSEIHALLSVARGCEQLVALRQFLYNQFRVTTDLSAARDQLQQTVRVLSDGLSTWVPRMRADSGIFRIQATAGSGKTQLALHLLEQAVAQDRRASYVCFNRTLADYIRARAPAHAEVVNFHELAVEHARRSRGEPDFSRASILDEAAARYVADSGMLQARLDLLIIDEGQDFEPSWIEALCQRLKLDGRLYLLEDDDQRIYPRPAVDIAGAVLVDSRDNFRSPRMICELINTLQLAASPINSLSPYKGELPGFHLYDSAESLPQQVVKAVQVLLARGFALSDIAVLYNCGRNRSQLAALDRIGDWRLRQFDGTYDASGEPNWSEGSLLLESVYRFKGQSAPAVVVAEVAFDSLSVNERRKLFVALTRAQMAVEIVLSVQAEQVLACHMQNLES